MLEGSYKGLYKVAELFKANKLVLLVCKSKSLKRYLLIKGICKGYSKKSVCFLFSKKNGFIQEETVIPGDSTMSGRP